LAAAQIEEMARTQRKKRMRSWTHAAWRALGWQQRCWQRGVSACADQRDVLLLLLHVHGSRSI